MSNETLDLQETILELNSALKAVYAMLDQSVQYTRLKEDLVDSHRKITILRGDCQIARNFIEKHIKF